MIYFLSDLAQSDALVTSTDLVLISRGTDRKKIKKYRQEDKGGGREYAGCEVAKPLPSPATTKTDNE